METSIYLAQVIGLFGAITTFTIIIRYKFYLSMEEIISNNPATIYMSGFMFILLGLLVVVSHQIWSMDWRVIITILGWLLLLKGLLRILFTNTVQSLLIKKQSEKRFIFGEILTFVISVFLICKGFFTYS